MITQYIKKLVNKFLAAEKSHTIIAKSFAFGNLIAWLPIIPVQTPVLILLGYIFKFNNFIAVTTLYIINNPFTLIPIYISDYFTGQLLFEKILHIDISRYNPEFIVKFTKYLSKYINIDKYFGKDIFSIWNLFFGGFILGLVTTIILYFILKYILKYFIKTQK